RAAWPRESSPGTSGYRTPNLRSGVLMPSSWRPAWARRLRSNWTLPGNWLGDASPRGRHGPAPPPVADGVVLRPAQPPATAQIGPDRADDRRLGRDPGEDVAAG